MSFTPISVEHYRWTGGLIVDNFAGGGGASTGVAQGLGQSPDIAVNHNAEALAMHKKNHPDTQHYNESVWDIDIRKVCDGKPVLMGWFSPDCTHFSVAKGGKPVKKAIRGLAWIVKKWWGQSDLAIIQMENVVEFTTWGPLIAKRCPKTKRVIKLVPDGERKGKKVFKEVVSAVGEQVPYREQALVPDKKRAGKTFKQFISQLRKAGYQVEWKEKGLVASDFGAPTTRKRFILLARKDGLPIVWPEATHGDPKKAPTLEKWETAGNNLDWSIPCPSIFKEGRRPLADNTLRRIARGIQKFVIDAGDDAFLVKQGGPLKAGSVMTNTTGHPGRSLHCPLPTITTAGNQAAVECQLLPVETGFIATIDHTSSSDTSTSMEQPIGTVTSKARHIRVAALLKHYSGVVGQDLTRPLPTITAVDHNSVMEASLEVAHIQRDFGNSVGQAMDAPLGAITAGGGGKSAVIASSLVKLRGTSNHGQSLDAPLDTVSAQGNHFAQVQAFLIKFYSTGGNVQSLNDPLATIASRDTFGLVTIKGVDYQIVDIGMRMLEPHELYRCQGFPADYIHDFVSPLTGKPLPKHAQVRMVGNSVPPALARALTEANVPKWALERKA